MEYSEIPRFVESRFGAGSLFKLLISWRSDAHKGKTQDKLNTEYATVVEPYTTGGAKNKGVGSKKKNKFGQSADSNQGSRSSDGNGTDTNGGDGSAGQSRKRIRNRAQCLTGCRGARGPDSTSRHSSE